MGFSTYSANKILDLLLRGVEFTPPTRVYVALHTADPGNTGASEVSTADWPSYVRQDPAGGAAIDTGFDAGANKHSENAKQMLFPRHDGASPVTIAYASLWDAETGGNCLLTAQLVDSEGDTTTKTVNPDDEAVIYADELDWTLT